jgi:hypothetical protein
MHRSVEKRTFSRMLRGFVSCVLPFVLAGPIQAQNATVAATHDIVVAREQVTDHVLDIKGRFKESDAEYRTARELYRTAFAEFNAYIATVKAAIRRGKTDDLAKDPTYKKAAADASNAAKAFIDYADSKTGGQARALFLLGALFNQGINVLNAYKTGQAERRAQEAEEFEKDVKWPRWEEIK